MQSWILSFGVFLLTACATTQAPPKIAKITFLSMERATITETIIGSGDYSEDFDAPGYKIWFKSDREIATPPFASGKSFHGVEFYHCGNKTRYAPELPHPHSVRNYKPASANFGKLMKRQSDGSVIYEVEVGEDLIESSKGPMCGKVFGHGGNTIRKILQPTFVSNEMVLKLPK